MDSIGTYLNNIDIGWTYKYMNACQKCMNQISMAIVSSKWSLQYIATKKIVVKAYREIMNGA